jgi:hypothetical protein
MSNRLPRPRSSYRKPLYPRCVGIGLAAGLVALVGCKGGGRTAGEIAPPFDPAAQPSAVAPTPVTTSTIAAPAPSGPDTPPNAAGGKGESFQEKH